MWEANRERKKTERLDGGREEETETGEKVRKKRLSKEVKTGVRRNRSRDGNKEEHIRKSGGSRKGSKEEFTEAWHERRN